MGVRKTVFGSTAERRNFEKLSRQWGDKYRVYHNVPFLQVFDVTNLHDPVDLRPFTVATLDHQRLKKTSLDYVLCDEHASPLVSIDFDGLNDGFNVGQAYHARRQPDPWREQIMQLKLQVAHGSGFPYFVVASEHFEDFSGVRLTMVDGIIGEVFSLRATHERFARCFDPMEVGYTQERFDALSSSEQDELIQDWVVEIEVEADFYHNPIHRKVAELTHLAGSHIYEVRRLESPPIPDGLPMRERVRRFFASKLHGASCTLTPADRPPVQKTVWLPNFQAPHFSMGLGLVEELAHLLALTALLGQRAPTDTQPSCVS